MRGTSTINEVQFLARVVFDIALPVEDGSLRFPEGEERVVIIGQYPFKFGVVADACPPRSAFLSRTTVLMRGPPWAD